MDCDLSPDKILSFRILLDRLYRSGESCGCALSQVREGKATREAYARLLHEQIANIAGMEGSVVRSALQFASSIAGLMLTTEALISEVPEEDKKMPDGGMGGMGGGF